MIDLKTLLSGQSPPSRESNVAEEPDDVKIRLEKLRIRIEREFSLMEMQIRDRRQT